MPAESVSCTFKPYSVTFCSLLEVASGIISSGDADCPQSWREMWLPWVALLPRQSTQKLVVKGGTLCLYHFNFKLEPASDVCSGIAVEEVGPDICVQFTIGLF